ncbi:MAG TPA: NPCBM/NEW2 domain-containing protein, partial [Roseimicrobium sp.]|nr:NPCBM/NEW2 domain-containing protein [Roseimicrobium sp.]
SFLTLAEALRLAGHPMFSGSVKGMGDKPSVKPADIRIEPRGKGFVFSGRVQADPPVYGVVAYMDPEGGSDYDAATATAVPDSQGRFSIDCQAFAAGKAGELRVTFLQANGVPSGNLSDTPFRYPYTVSKEGKADITLARTKLLLVPLVQALNEKNVAEARTFLTMPAVTGDSRLKEIVERLVGTLDPKYIDPTAIPATTGTIPLSDLKAVREFTGYGAPVRDRLPESGGLLIAGAKIYAHGFYAHAVATHEWQLDGSWKTLSGVAGLADGNDGSVGAVIEGDGKVLWESKTLKSGNTVPFQVDITGVKSLVLKMGDAGDGKRADWGVWLEPVLAR